MKMRCAAIAFVSLFGNLASADSASAPASYAALPAHKALAFVVDDASVVGVASGEPSDQAASVSALEQCNAARRTDAGVCELTRLNDADITTGAQIRAAVPRQPHPLFLWQFDAGASRVYLAGSIHVMKAALFPLPPQFDGAFQRSGRLAVEVNAEAVAPVELAQKFRTYAMLPAGQSVDSVLRPATLTLATQYLQTQAMTLASVATLKPTMLATQLAVSRLSALGYLPEFGLERHFIGAAGNRPILELETLDDQLAVLTSPTMSVQDEILADTLGQMDDVEPIVAAMIVAWLAGDDREFRRLFDLQSGSSPDVLAFMRRLLEDRNRGMADTISGYLTEPRTTFVLVGAAHLIGPEGIVALLEARGLHGRRIGSDDTIEN